MRNVARAWIGVSEVDILKEEGLQYGEMLKSEGVKVEMVVYEKAPHTAVAMDSEILFPFFYFFCVVLIASFFFFFLFCVFFILFFIFENSQSGFCSLLTHE